jgi:hypothetical protein
MYFLIVLPFIAIAFDGFYGFVKNKFVPPIGESLAKFTLVQTITMVAILVARGESGPIVNLGYFISILLFFVLIAYIWISQRQEDLTKRHLDQVFKENVESRSGGVNINILRELGDRLVDPDFIEKSAANDWSDYKRRQWRGQYVALLKEAATVHQNIEQEGLLVPGRESHKTVKVNRWCFILSLLLFVFYVVFFVIYALSNNR